ncbi:MAG: ATP synthase F1 subunit delta [Thermoanaerobaculaceae bacterium]|nr:ATP synthase F1 subunit delta [Thermoanaerobaculaceae bacterium]TAM48703.1 MAG: ATP synthase F1 subunit delta [Acidobacteriota bacterium]
MSRRVARPYAVALYEVTHREGIPALREIERQLASVAELFGREPGLLRVFEVPSVAPATKRELVATIAGALALRPEAHRMLVALAAHVRLRFLPEVVQMFRELVDRAEGIVRAHAELPVAPRPEQVEALQRALARLFASRVELETKVRPELLAGFVVQVGSQVFDGSLAAQVRRFAAAAGR